MICQGDAMGVRVRAFARLPRVRRVRHTGLVFPLTYAAHELRRRLGRTILTALGLAAGVGLVIGIIGVSDGLDQAQGKVLAPLKSVGTDVLVTRVMVMRRFVATGPRTVRNTGYQAQRSC